MAATRPKELLPAVVADIGGTHARFAHLTGQGDLGPVTTLSTPAFRGVADALEAFLAQSGGPRPVRLALAVAAPVLGNEVALTNANWHFSVRDLKARLNLAVLEVVNDYEALALALPHLTAADRVCIGPPGGDVRDGAPMAVLGPGTGLGMAGLMPVGARWYPVTSECGYIGLSPLTDEELAVFRVLRDKYGRVSVERVLSGPGLVDLYGALAFLDNRKAEDVTPEAIITAAQNGSDRIAVDTLRMFCDLLGGLAGDVALLFLARGGVYLAGGILPRIVDILKASGFRERFEHKGRGNHVVAPIPTCLITHAFPTMLGCAIHLTRVREDHV